MISLARNEKGRRTCHIKGHLTIFTDSVYELVKLQCVRGLCLTRLKELHFMKVKYLKKFPFPCRSCVFCLVAGCQRGGPVCTCTSGKACFTHVMQRSRVMCIKKSLCALGKLNSIRLCHQKTTSNKHLEARLKNRSALWFCIFSLQVWITRAALFIKVWCT